MSNSGSKWDAVGYKLIVHQLLLIAAQPTCANRVHIQNSSYLIKGRSLKRTLIEKKYKSSRKVKSKSNMS